MTNNLTDSIENLKKNIMLQFSDDLSDVSSYELKSSQDYANLLHILQFSAIAIPATLIAHTKIAISNITYFNNKNLIIDEGLTIMTVVKHDRNSIILQWSVMPPTNEKEEIARLQMIEDFGKIDDCIDSFISFIKSVYNDAVLDFTKPLELIIDIVNDPVLKISYYLLTVRNSYFE